MSLVGDNQSARLEEEVGQGELLLVMLMVFRSSVLPHPVPGQQGASCQAGQASISIGACQGEYPLSICGPDGLVADGNHLQSGSLHAG